MTQENTSSLSSAANHPQLSSVLEIAGARKAAIRAALGAGVLALSKLILFFLSGSMVVALSAWDSALDVCVSAINQKVIHFARQKPDEKHPYGHGKAESMAALVQGALILGGALLIVVSSGQKIWEAIQGKTAPISHPWPTAAFFLLSATVSILITRGLKRASKKYNSPALEADSEHYRSDVVANIASAISIALIALSEIPWLDPLLATVFAFNIGHGGSKLIATSVDDLLDHDLPDNFKEEVLKVIAESNEQIIDVHNFRGRRSGHRYFIDFHITLPSNLDFRSVHEITEHVEEVIEKRFDADVVVHADPADNAMIRSRTAPGIHRMLHPVEKPDSQN
ncbi:MAG: cation diffusion facilitator family transporter [Silvanigrellaceae bacterium]